jgi:hypothetical protein
VQERVSALRETLFTADDNVNPAVSVNIAM